MPFSEFKAKRLGSGKPVPVHETETSKTAIGTDAKAVIEEVRKKRARRKTA